MDIAENKNIGKVGLIEPIMVFGKSFGIKLLSVYDFLRCEIMYKNLVSKLTSQCFDKKLCRQVSEHACIVSMCFYSSDKQRIFMDGFSALSGLTPEELKKIYNEYLFLHNKTIKFDEFTSGILKDIKDKYKHDIN
ncbi:MAG: hypothetical protein LBR79_05805 [Oscillospiraceae bacterium]|jgi:hypothetical protein|nr:hypothetical protein [Oscillospiraceae bacterium]